MSLQANEAERKPPIVGRHNSPLFKKIMEHEVNPAAKDRWEIDSLAKSIAEDFGEDFKENLRASLEKYNRGV